MSELWATTKTKSTKYPAFRAFQRMPILSMVDMTVSKEKLRRSARARTRLASASPAAVRVSTASSAAMSSALTYSQPGMPLNPSAAMKVLLPLPFGPPTTVSVGMSAPSLRRPSAGKASGEVRRRDASRSCRRPSRASSMFPCGADRPGKRPTGRHPPSAGSAAPLHAAPRQHTPRRGETQAPSRLGRNPRAVPAHAADFHPSVPPGMSRACRRGA
jgi:hypothetical protein